MAEWSTKSMPLVTFRPCILKKFKAMRREGKERISQFDRKSLERPDATKALYLLSERGFSGAARTYHTMTVCIRA